jgi:transposase, IS5 family
MRQKSDAVLCFTWSDASDALQPKIVRVHRDKYKRLSEILDANPACLDGVAGDLRSLSQGSPRGRRGRKAVYTAENLLRALIVHTVEGESLRDTIVRIAESPFLQDFLRLGNRRVMDFTFLDKAFKAIQPETWKALNAVLAGYAVASKRIDPKEVRVDTTVTETTIHYPTDSSLLWDSWRVLVRLLRAGRTLVPAWCAHRFHDRIVKRAFHRIVRYGKSPAKARKRLVKRSWRVLIDHVRRIADIASAFTSRSRSHPEPAVQGIGSEMEGYLASVRTVLSTAERANLHGEKVPASERVFSLFEPHTELISRGRSGKPVEFGHVVMLAQTKGKFISDYEVMEHRIPDQRLGLVSVENHERLFGSAPEVLAADKGFHPQAPGRAALAEKVKTLAIPRKLSDWAEVIGATWQRFRAGIEGTISVLKRAYRLLRCPYRGFKSFAASVGMSLFCHNLVLLARPPGE